VVFTTKGTPDEVRKRVEKEAAHAAAGLPSPPSATSGPAPVGAPARPVSREISRPGVEPPERPAGLKGLWSRITGR
jgi:hypothetical protein